jgi:hypothetical protein
MHIPTTKEEHLCKLPKCTLLLPKLLYLKTPSKIYYESKPPPQDKKTVSRGGGKKTTPTTITTFFRRCIHPENT